MVIVPHYDYTYGIFTKKSSSKCKLIYSYALTFQNLRSYSARLGEIQRYASSTTFTSACRHYKDDIWKPTEEEVRRNLLNSNNFDDLAQTNTLIGDWCPFGLREDHEEIGNFLQFHASGSRACPTWKAFTIFRETPCKIGVRFDVDFYGGDSDQLIQHLLEFLLHVSRGQSYTDVDLCVHITIYFPTNISDAELSDFSIAYGWSIGPYGGLREMILVEQK